MSLGILQPITDKNATKSQNITSELTNERKDKIQSAIIKTFVMARIPFQVIEHPYVIEM